MPGVGNRGSRAAPIAKDLPPRHRGARKNWGRTGGPAPRDKRARGPHPNRSRPWALCQPARHCPGRATPCHGRIPHHPAPGTPSMSPLMNLRGLLPRGRPYALWASCLTPWASSCRPPSPNLTDSPCMCPWFRASVTDPPTPRPTADHPRPRACLPRGCPSPRDPATPPAFAHQPVPGHLQSQPTGQIPFGCARSWCRRPSSPGPRGARNPPWRGPESRRAPRSCSLACGFEDAAHPTVFPAVWPGRGPRGEGGSESPRGAEAGGAGAGWARWLPPRKPLAPPAKDSPCPAHSAQRPPPRPGAPHLGRRGGGTTSF